MPAKPQPPELRDVRVVGGGKFDDVLVLVLLFVFARLAGWL